LDEGDELNKFFGTLRKFNDQNEIDLGMKKKMEAFFDFRWKNDRNVFFSTEKD
jgi:hypothetical protein